MIATKRAGGLELPIVGLGTWGMGGKYEPDHSSDEQDIRKMLADIASKYRATPAQLALAWTISRRNVVALFKTSSTDHLSEDLGALDIELSEEDIALLDRSFPRGETMNA